MLPRRDLLRLLGVTPLALPLLSACGSSNPSAGGMTQIGLVASDLRRVAGDPGAAPSAAGSIAALAHRLYAELGQGPGNLAFSPYSISVALAMTVNGARGRTAEEMLEVLAVDDLHHFNAGLNALTQHLEGLAGEQKSHDGTKLEVVLDAANSLWGQADVTWGKAFLDVLARDYGTGMRTVDYRTAHEDARTKINAWTAEQTRDKITELIPHGVLDALTRLVLVNAIYLKAPWLIVFEESLTQDGSFRLRNGEQVSLPFMTTGSPDFAYQRGDGWEAARLLYAGGELAMTVVLPDDIETFDADLIDVLAGTAQGTADLRLPRWKVRTQAPLKQILSVLGMPTAFTDAADFGGMTTEEALQIAEVLHEAFVAVDEKGTEAAAATAVVARATSAPVAPRVLTVDRPFLYVIHDVQHGTPLFVGRVDDPSDEG